MLKKSDLSRSMRPPFNGTAKIERQVYRKECRSPSKKSQTTEWSELLV